MSEWILTLNGGSSSLKFATFAAGSPPQRQIEGEIERVGLPGAALKAKDANGRVLTAQPIAAPDLAAAVERVADWLAEHVGLAGLIAVGHRIVHGGPRFCDTQRITPEILAGLGELAPLDPEHLPGEIAIVRAVMRRLPQVPQVACFDTAFHRDLPRQASLLPIPLEYERSGVRRYGFHGLSYAYLMEELTRIAGATAAAGRIVLAHLGSGASMAAVRDGRCLDTTMSFTPTAGLVMATRCGDLDPGVLIHLARSRGFDPEQLSTLVNKKSGLLGMSETSSDMRDLMAHRADDSRARDAVAVFCYQARKWIGAMAAALGGIDTLVFSGGIGEHSADIRAEICAELGFLGLRLDPQSNTAGEAVISTSDSPTTVRVIHTDEESMIAREVARLMTDKH